MADRRIIVYSTTSAAPEPEPEVAPEPQAPAFGVAEPTIGLSVDLGPTDWVV
jgi:hypothetical protein